MSIAALKNDKEICVRLVAYLENELVKDPVVMVDYQKGTKWMPSRPALSLDSWTAFKAAARKTAEPALSVASQSTPGIDRLFAQAMNMPYRDDQKKFATARERKKNDANALPDDQVDKDPEKMKVHKDLLARLSMASDLFDRLNQALTAYQPLSEGGGSPHEGMVNAAKIYATLARAEKAMIDADRKLLVRYLEDVASS